MVGMVDMVSPSAFPVQLWNPEHILDCAERHAERADFCARPVANARQFACAWVDVDIVFKEVDMVGYKGPLNGCDIPEAWDEPI